MDNKTVIGEINVEVKSGINVDEKTARFCMDLLSIHFKNEGCKGVVLRFDEGPLGEVDVMPLLTDNEVNATMFAKFNCKEETKGD